MLVAIVVLTAAAHAAGFAFTLLNREPLHVDPFFFALAFASLTVVGAVLVLRAPANQIGWIFLCLGLLFSLASPAAAYVHQPERPGVAVVQVIGDTVWLLAFALLIRLIAVFPSGTVVTRRWRPLLWAWWVALPSAVGSLLQPRPTLQDMHRRVTNPLAIPALAPVRSIAGFVGLLFAPVAVVALVSAVVRFVRSRGAERQQLKLFVYAVVTGAGALFASAALLPNNAASDLIGTILLSLVLVAVATSVAVAVLRYRLYDIDRVISRTVSYAMVTALLGAVFAVVVLLPTAAIGSGRAPSWLIALATLAVATLFRPVRRRIQHAVDHRFNRKRYDAERTIDAFAQRLRDQVDIDALRAELCQVVDATMQPRDVSLWLTR